MSYVVNNLTANMLIVDKSTIGPFGTIVVDTLSEGIIEGRAANILSITQQTALSSLDAATLAALEYTTVSVATLPLPPNAATATGVASGLASVVTALGTPLQDHGTVSVANFPATQTTTDGGTKITAATMPSGGFGITGWLSAIFNSIASLVTTSAGTAQRQVLVDPVTGNGALIQAFHSADNQTIPGTSYGIMTGSVDQMVNGAGNLDRKRSVSGDAMAVTGLAAEVPMIYNGATYDRSRGINGRNNVEPLSSLGVARQLSVTSTSNSATLTTTVTRMSLVANGCAMRFVIGTGAQTANASTSHYLQTGERMDVSCATSSTVAAIALYGGTGTLEITELGV